MNAKNKPFKIDYRIARRGYNANGWFMSGLSQIDEKFRSAYLVTNEDLRESVQKFGPVAGADVLTVAASGDQPILYASLGANNIDTFDQTFCAKAIMDLKVAAIQKLSRFEYQQLLCDLRDTQQHNKPAIMGCHAMCGLWSAMPADTAEFIHKMSDCRIFAAETTLLNINRSVPTEPEWDALKQRQSNPFNFIWTNIINLHTQLTQKYDIINISNICEWLFKSGNKTAITPVLQNLFNSLKNGGYILGVQLGDYGLRHHFHDAAYQIGNTAYTRYWAIDNMRALTSLHHR